VKGPPHFSEKGPAENKSGPAPSALVITHTAAITTANIIMSATRMMCTLNDFVNCLHYIKQFQ